MHHALRRGAVAAALLLATAGAASAQDDASVRIANGGIFVDGWRGVIDAREASNGMTLNDARFESRGEDLHVRTGPATTLRRVRPSCPAQRRVLPAGRGNRSVVR